MHLQCLGYLGVCSSHSEEWEHFATQILGLQLHQKADDQISFRTDALAQRLFVDAGEGPERYVIGWQAAGIRQLEALATSVERFGIPVSQGSEDLASQRMVDRLISFVDPAGNDVEIFIGPKKADTPFSPGRTISGFRTGKLGLGHVVFNVMDIEAARRFYQEALGFRLSDYTIEPFKACFFHINGRHHSLALVESSRNDLHHVMIELNHLDDVGQGYDLALERPDMIGVSLGRHSNDYMTSFYLRSPSGFLVEYGWGGREIDPSTWTPHELKFGPSLWGHDRSWLPENVRRAANDLTKASAEFGNRAPIQVSDGNFERAIQEE